MDISVVVPSFNSGTYLLDALHSAIRQVPGPLEVIVQDGGSTDGSLELLAQCGDPVDWVTEPDSGQADALNRAIARSSGDVIVWLNADDLIAPGAFSAVEEAFAMAPAADFVFGNFDAIDPAGNLLRRFTSSEYDPRRVFVHGCYIFSGAIFYRRAFMDRIGPFDPTLQTCMDLDYMLRLGSARGVHTRTTVAQFRITDQQKSSTMRRQFLREAHALRWRAAAGSTAVQALTLALDIRDSAYLVTHRFRHTRAWGRVRGQRQL